MHKSRNYKLHTFTKDYTGDFRHYISNHNRTELLKLLYRAERMGYTVANSSDDLKHLDSDRTYMIVSPSGKVVDTRKWERDLAKVRDAESKKAVRHHVWYINNYVYRFDPVERTGRVRYNRGSVYRLARVKGIVTEAANTEYKEFNHPKNNRYKFVRWDEELVRHKDKSWKTSCKVRKQWMKHQNRHFETSYSLGFEEAFDVETE